MVGDFFTRPPSSVKKLSGGMNFTKGGGNVPETLISRGFKNGRPLMAQLLLRGRCFNAFLAYFTTRSRMHGYEKSINRTVTISSVLYNFSMNEPLW